MNKLLYPLNKGEILYENEIFNIRYCCFCVDECGMLR